MSAVHRVEQSRATEKIERRVWREVPAMTRRELNTKPTIGLGAGGHCVAITPRHTRRIR